MNNTNIVGVDNINNFWDLHNEILSDLKEDDNVIDNSEKENSGCFICGSTKLVKDNNLYYCEKCGTHNEYIISLEQEYYDNNSSNSRCGMPINTLFPKLSMSSISLGGNSYGTINRIDKWNNMVYKEKSLLGIFNFIKKKVKINIFKIKL
mgnify:CR=1 FL=1